MQMDLIPGLPNDIGLECLIRVPYQDFSSIASVCRSWNRVLELPEFWRRRKASGLTRKVIVMAQSRVDPKREHGLKKYVPPVYRLTVCEPKAGYWVELPPIPEYSSGLPMLGQLVGVGSNLVVMGGFNPLTYEVSNDVFVYNFVSGKWRCGASMPGCQRFFFACASDFNRTVFVAGGHDSEKCALKSATAYDVEADKWVDLPVMTRERDEAKGVFGDGKFHVIGGYHTSTQGGFETSLESFDVATWQWGPVRDNFLNSAMCPTNRVDYEDGKWFVSRDAYVEGLRGLKWQVVANVPTSVRNISYMTAWQGKVFVIGSEQFGSTYQSFLLDLKSSEWKKVKEEEDFSGHVQSGCCLEL